MTSDIKHHPTTLMEDSNLKPGLFTLPLAINRGNVKDVAKYKFAVLEKYVKSKLERPERHAIRNLLGLLSARTERYEDAMKYFKLILSEDPTNLNALANMESLCKTLYKFREAKEFEAKLLYEMAPGHEITSSTEIQKWRTRKARCLAEQAYAFTFEIWNDAIDNERFHKAHNLYVKAMEMAGNGVDIKERQDWEFADAVACRAIAKTYLRHEPYSHGRVWIGTSLHCFYKITQECDDDQMKSESWRHIADILKFFQYEPRFLKDASYYDALLPYFKNPQLCLHKAMEITPRDPRLLARMARMIQFTDYEKSLQLLQDSLDIDSSEYNRFAFVIRGEVLLNKYRASLQKGSASPPDRNLLVKAKADIEQALSLNETPFDYSNLAIIWNLLSKDINGQLLWSEGKACLQKSLFCHTKAINCQNGVMSDIVNKRRGESLFDAREYDASLASFKWAIECQPKTARNPDYFTHLMRGYLTMIAETRPEEANRGRLLMELTCWAKVAASKYNIERLKKQTASPLWTKFPNEMELFLDHCKKTHHQGIVQAFSRRGPRASASSYHKTAVSLKAQDRQFTESLLAPDTTSHGGIKESTNVKAAKKQSQRSVLTDSLTEDKDRSKDWIQGRNRKVPRHHTGYARPITKSASAELKKSRTTGFQVLEDELGESASDTEDECGEVSGRKF